MQNLFYFLPLATVVNRRTFCVHGGLCRLPGVGLAEIRSVGTQRHCPLPSDTSREDTIFFDFMWRWVLLMFALNCLPSTVRPQLSALNCLPSTVCPQLS